VAIVRTLHRAPHSSFAWLGFFPHHLFWMGVYY